VAGLAQKQLVGDVACEVRDVLQASLDEVPATGIHGQ